MLEHYKAFIDAAQQRINELPLGPDDSEATLVSRDGCSYTFMLDDDKRILAVVYRHPASPDADTEWVH